MARDGLEIQSLSAIEHILAHKPDRIEQLFLSVSGTAASRVRAIEATARRMGIKVDTSVRGGAEPARARLRAYEYAQWDSLLYELSRQQRCVVLALDHLQDPQNFGALCRTAEGLGVAAVLTPKDRAVAVGPGVYHASAGAVETVPIALVGNLTESLKRLKENGFWILGTTCSSGATRPEEIPNFDKTVLVLGAEGEGLSHAVEKICDWKTEIPLSGKIQSLNVNAAGAILLHFLVNRI